MRAPPKLLTRSPFNKNRSLLPYFSQPHLLPIIPPRPPAGTSTTPRTRRTSRGFTRSSTSSRSTPAGVVQGGNLCPSARTSVVSNEYMCSLRMPRLWAGQRSAPSPSSKAALGGRPLQPTRAVAESSRRLTERQGRNGRERSGACRRRWGPMRRRTEHLIVGENPGRLPQQPSSCRWRSRTRRGPGRRRI